MRESPASQPPRDDATLIDRAKGAASAFGDLYTKYVRDIYRYVFERVGKSREVAEDLTQDIFIRAWQGIGRFTHRGYSYGTYLTTIARNLLVNYYTRRRNGASLDEVEAVLPRLSVEDCLHYTLTLDPDVALLGLSYPNEQDIALAAARTFQPLPEARMEDIHRRAVEARREKGPCWWNPDPEA